jgi:hypothetical protein
MNYSKIRTDTKQFKALTSMSIEEFDRLLPRFEAEWEHFIEHYTLSGKPRQRKYAPKEKEGLTTASDKLFFILYYLKNNPLQEALAASFSLEQEVAHQWIHLLEALLKKALKAYAPERNSIKVNEQLQAGQPYLLDAMERAIPRDTYQQEEFFSGKKKRHTLKNLLLTNLVGTIIFLSITVSGKCADKPLAEQQFTLTQPIEVYADLAFLALPAERFKLILPHKKPRNKELTKIQKVQNRLISRIRVKVEHHFAHLKVLRIIRDVCRNYKFNFRQEIIDTACRLHNFRIDNRIRRLTFYL